VEAVPPKGPEVVSIDTTIIGETAASLMDDLPQETGGEIVAVGIVVICDAGDESYMRIKCSNELFYAQLGIFSAALECVKSGTAPDDK
jgi:hypothetical protein